MRYPNRVAGARSVASSMERPLKPAALFGVVGVHLKSP
jgi:hypothetical protein